MPSDLGQSRKRASVACNSCRKRKRKCDGSKPVCILCKRSAVDCTYLSQDTARATSRVSSTESIKLSQRLGLIESLLKDHSDIITDAQSQGFDSSVTKSGNRHRSSPQSNPESTGTILNTSITQDELTSPPQNTMVTSDQGNAWLSTIGEDLPPMLNPLGHSTTTSSLLSSPLVKSLLGEIPSDLFFRVDVGRHSPSEIFFDPRPLNSDALPLLDRNLTDHFIDAFLEQINVLHPILAQDDLVKLYDAALRYGLRNDLDSALCLMALTLGQVALKHANQPMDSDEPWYTGSTYATPAIRILLSEYLMSFGTGLALPQGLYLAALYFSFVFQPLLSWRMIHMASTNLQHLHIQNNGPFQFQPLVRLSWAVFVHECDLIAEHHLPTSGVERLIENLAFPVCGNQPDKNFLYWLADLSIRRLLNRIHHTLYDTGKDTSQQIFLAEETSIEGSNHHYIRSIMKVAAELEYQLDVWYDLLPEDIKPNLAETATKDIHGAILLLRYHSAKEIIFRPFVMYTASLPKPACVPNILIQNSHKCLKSCFSYLSAAEKRLETPSDSAEAIIQSALAITVVLTLASLSSHLSHFVPDIDLHQLRATQMIQRWAHSGSGIEPAFWILRSLRDKTRMVRRTKGYSRCF